VTHEGRGQIVPVDQRMSALAHRFASNKQKIARVLPRGASYTPERIMQIALIEVSRNAALLDCEPTSIITSVVTAASLGLEIGPVAGHAYLVPFKQRCQLIPGYRGLLHLVRLSGQISSIFAELIRGDEKWSYEAGTTRRLYHEPDDREEGKPWHTAYAVARLAHFPNDFELAVMSRGKVLAIRDASPGFRKPDSPWKTHEEEMAKKTVLRRLCKTLPISTEASRLIHLDDQHARGELQTVPAELGDLERLSRAEGAAPAPIDGEHAPVIDVAPVPGTPAEMPADIDPETGERIPSPAEIEEMRAQEEAASKSRKR